MSGFRNKLKQNSVRLFDKVRPGSHTASPAPLEADTKTDLPAAPDSGGHAYVDPQTRPTATATAGSVIYELLADGSEISLSLKAALVGVVEIWDVCERTSRVKNEFKKLESRIAHLNAVAHALKKGTHLDPTVKLRLDSIADLFERLTTCVEWKLERGTTTRIIEPNTDISEVKSLLMLLSARIEAFIYESIVRFDIGEDAILSRLSTTEAKALQRELERWSEIALVIKSALGDRRVYAAAHDAQPGDSGCMPGTRVGVLSRSVSWVKHDLRRVIWLSGLAGTGKTSVAITLCRMLDSDPDVLFGGAFFCSRTASEEAREDVRCILPTLSSSLADRSPKFAADLAVELRPNAGVAAYMPAKDQIKLLLQGPLSALSGDICPIVFVIDALDECSNKHELAELLAGIVRFNSSANVKFILTSRPETYILDSPIADPLHNEILQLQKIDTEEVTEDIRLYIANTFSQYPLDVPWYTDTDVTTLATLSNGLFVFASTMLSYVLDTDTVEDRTHRLQTALAAVVKSKVAMGPLDDMYESVLIRASNTAIVEPEELEATQRVLACILAARLPLSANMLAELLDMKFDHSTQFLRRLQAVVYVPEAPDKPGVRILHASFGDYLFDRAPHNVRIAKSLGHDILAHGCLKRMAWDDLCFNLSCSRSSFEANDPSSAGRIALSLGYACLQWAHHLAAASETSLLDEISEQIFMPKFLFWLEALSVLGKVATASGQLRVAGAVVKRDLMSRFLRDANSFVASSREAIERSAPHIYLSALPFADRDTLVYQIFSPLCTGLVSIETFGINCHGQQLSMMLTGHENRVVSVVYSPDGCLLASGSTDGTIRIWDTRTGEENLCLSQSGEDAVNDIAFAPNSKSIASGTDSGVYIWTGLAGRPTALLLSGHSDDVMSVEYSPDGNILASRSKDRTIRLWRAENGENTVILRGHDGHVDAIAFSPNGQTLAFCSSEYEIQLRGIRTGEPVGLLHLQSGGKIRSIGFSPDGTMLAAGCDNGTIVLLECQTGNTVTELRGHTGCISSIQFSPDARSLVSASHDKCVRFWTFPQVTREAFSTILVGHSHYVRRAAFSPDGLYIASASDDRTIRIWDPRINQTAIQPLPAHDSVVTSAVISSDSSIIVSGSYDRTIRLWDFISGEQKLQPLVGHVDVVLSVAISPDGQFIASTSDDLTIRMWDAHTGEAVGEPLRGHKGGVTTAIFAPNGRSLASGSWDRTVRIWNTATALPFSIGPLVCTDVVNTVTFSPNGVLLAAGDSGRRIYLWNAASGQPVREPLQASSYVASVAFSHTGAQIVSAGLKTVCIWDTTSGQQVLSFHAHNSRVYSAKFSPDDRFICTSSADHAIYIWDVSTGAIADTLYGHEDVVRSATFTPDGQSIVSCSEDGTIRVWDVRKSCSLSSDRNENDLSGLIFTNFAETRGWVLSESGQLLLWVPEEYRAHLQAPPCTLIIRPRRIVITAGPSGLHRGDEWAQCWNNIRPSSTSRSL